jgi:hypothetical protein
MPDAQQELDVALAVEALLRASRGLIERKPPPSSEDVRLDATHPGPSHRALKNGFSGPAGVVTERVNAGP